MTEAMREKMSARRVLAILVGLLATVMALQGLASVKPGGFEAFAQTTPTGPTIEFLNPDATSSNRISDKQDADAAYHIVAAVSSVPSNPTVRFELRDDTTRVAVIDAVRVGSSDTFEAFWQVPDAIADGDYTLEAQLFSNGVFVSKDDEAVVVNQLPGTATSPPQDAPAETVEIVYPTNTGSLGYSDDSEGTRRFIIRVIASADTPAVAGFYSNAAPGTEPAYKSCGAYAPLEDSTENTNGTHSGNVICEVAAADKGLPVTAVAVVVNDTPFIEDGAPAQAQFKDSGDGHRVTSYYLQDATSVSVLPVSSQATKATCVVRTATVFDQQGARMYGQNVDVHATGPTNNLKFDTLETISDAAQAPDQGAHSTEEAIECEDDGTTAAGGTQGFHPSTGLEVKHIESVDETDTNGEFVFALYSPDAGGTQITAFADEDGNDSFCSAEAAGNSSIGWDQAPPSPTGVTAEQTSCPKPTPGQTTTPTPTPTASNTTARPTNTATSTGPTTDRTVTMAVDRAKVVAGRQVTFSGQILSGDQSCTDNEFVQIRRRVLGTTTFRNLLTTATDSQGRFTFSQRVTKSADYTATATAHDNCREATSGEVTVLVKVKLQILASDTSPNRGDRFRIKSSVTPQHDGTKLILQRKKGSRWVKVATDTLNRRSRATFVVSANFRSRTFRTFWRSQDAEHESNGSRRVTIKT